MNPAAERILGKTKPEFLGESSVSVEHDTLREERYRSLFENRVDGCAYCQILFDPQRRPVDFVYLDVNPAFETKTGLKDIVGHKVSQVIPDIQESNPEVVVEDNPGDVRLTIETLKGAKVANHYRRQIDRGFLVHGRQITEWSEIGAHDTKLTQGVRHGKSARRGSTRRR